MNRARSRAPVLQLALAGGLLALAAAATPPARTWGPNFHQTDKVLYAAWGGSSPQVYQGERTLLSAIDLASGKPLWSLEGIGQLYVADEQARPGSDIPARGGLLFLDGLMGDRFGLFAIDVERQGEVAWFADGDFLRAVGSDRLFTSQGKMLNPQTGAVVGQQEPCTDALFLEHELLCLRRRSDREGPDPCDFELWRYPLGEAAPDQPALRIEECAALSFLGRSASQLLLEQWVAGERYPSLLAFDPVEGRLGPRHSCNGFLQAHPNGETALCVNADDRTVRELGIGKGQQVKARDLPALRWAYHGPPTVDPTAARALLGVDRRSRSVLFQPGKGTVPLAAPGGTAIHRASWFGSENRVYLLDSENNLMAIDRTDLAVLWRLPDALAAGPSEPLRVWDTGENAGMVLRSGVVVSLDPRRGAVRARHFATESLWAAVAWGDLPRVEQLLASAGQAGAERPPPFFAPSVLRFAVERGDARIVSVLLDAGLRDEEHYRRPLLHEAAGRGHLEVVELLLLAGFDARVRDQYGRTALDLARKQGHTAIEEILKRKTNRWWWPFD